MSDIKPHRFFIDRSEVLVKCLPQAPYRNQIEYLHKDMFDEIQRLELALSVEQAQVKHMENLLGERDSKIEYLQELRHDGAKYYHSEVTRLNEQLAKFKDCVPVPNDVYSGIAYEIDELLCCGGLSMIKPKLAKQFLKASEEV